MPARLMYIDKVGVELEGGWNRLFVPKTHIIYDMSVGNKPWGPPSPFPSAKPCSCGDGCKTTCCHWGEIPSPALPFKDALQWTADHYPDGANLSCGLHVHVSLKSDILYAMLVSKNFFDSFLFAVEKWGKSEKLPKDHPFWERLLKKYDAHAPDATTTIARFCNRGFSPFKQIGMVHKDDARRSPLNYCHKMHGTIECRLFPAFDKVEQALSAIEFYVTFCDKWLQEQFSKETKRSIVIRI